MKDTQLVAPTKDCLQLMIPTASVDIILPGALALRKDLVERAAAIERVAGESSQQAAINLLNELQDLINATEKQRKEVKDPFLKAGKRIDEAAKTFIDQIEEQKSRLKGLCSDFQRAVLEKQRQAEAERLRLLREEEARRKQAEEELAKAQAVGDTAAVQQAEEKILTADMNAVGIVTAPIAAAPKAEGMKVVERWVTVVQDPAALYKTFPEFLTLTPKMREINAAVTNMATMQPDQPPSLPGCIITKETDVQTR